MDHGLKKPQFQWNSLLEHSELFEKPVLSAYSRGTGETLALWAQLANETQKQIQSSVAHDTPRSDSTNPTSPRPIAANPQTPVRTSAPTRANLAAQSQARAAASFFQSLRGTPRTTRIIKKDC